jgi:hypothetical protein
MMQCKLNAPRPPRPSSDQEAAPAVIFSQLSAHRPQTSAHSCIVVLSLNVRQSVSHCRQTSAQARQISLLTDEFRDMDSAATRQMEAQSSISEM